MMSKDYDAIIIGAGMAGLTCALSLCAEGKKVLVLERQPVAGGVATSFKRKGFKFEASLHFVDALASGEEVREFLDKHGVSQKIEFIELKEFGRVIYPEHDFVVKNDFESLKSWCEENFPHEKKGIGKFFADMKQFSSEFDRFMDSKLPLLIKFIIAPVFYRSIISTSCITLEQFISKRIKDNKLVAILGTIWGFIGLPPKELSAFYYLIVMRGCWGAKTAFIKGGFNRLFEAMVDRIREYGSEVRFNSCVKMINTDGGKQAKGVVLESGEQVSSRAVVSNANTIDTLGKLIDSIELKNFYSRKLDSMQKSISALTLYLGLDIPAKAVGMNNFMLSISNTYDHYLSYRNCLESKYENCGLAVVDHSQLDPQLAPAGKSTICVMALDNFVNWSGLSKEEYVLKKKKAGETILGVLEKYLPGITKHVEVMDIGTPLTMSRFPSLPEGAVYGLAQTVAQSGINRLDQFTRIKGLFLCGAWTRPGGGVHGCYVSGSEAAQFALKYLGI
jgi:prolycopene isomerase